MEVKYTFVLLAGGKSTRMGEDKGLANLKGKPMIKWLLDQIKNIDIEIIIVSNNQSYNEFGYRVIQDLVPEKGPMGGLYTALKSIKTKYCILLPCDTPMINQAVLNKLIQTHNKQKILVAKCANRLHPLFGIYAKNQVTKLRRSLNEGNLKMINFIMNNQSEFIDLEDFNYVFENINTKEQLNTLNNGM